ncbi:hypothetical protein MKK70_01610 [Methylobacterium sp. E-041]|jgi:hypothetical protein|uniref:hypothetical protein n=1 Tax=unclassified Methylobacterium TaxID=2615210 RepID=UPI001FB9D9B5|nr:MULTISPECIES: hypothetical protein [unclassified Methylobacterium]MCJ2008653.1 hypothetical protein [Methylobacterium sp. J-092]MCJ2038476.1 hypothetical protein [Methylobacterium sp. J-059]MCJ2104101.1 hypothetical protein [Methylobacterium sp. E-041]MCJ2114402.1 hypothetical protein [Methylobacterium sp. E-025]
MTVSRPAALRSDPPAVDDVAPRVPAGRVVPFPAAPRPPRRPEAGERRGEILLFLGVRYERLAS